MNVNDLSKMGTECRDAFIRESEDLERRLTRDQVQEAHDWMFAVREILYDFRRLDLSLCRVYGANDRARTAALLNDFAQMLLYEVIPHVQQHATDLENDLERILPKPNAPNS